MENRTNQPETSNLSKLLVNADIRPISIDVVEKGDKYLLPIGMEHRLMETTVESVYKDSFSCVGSISTTIRLNGSFSSGGILIKKPKGFKRPQVYVPQHVYDLIVRSTSS